MCDAHFSRDSKSFSIFLCFRFDFSFVRVKLWRARLRQDVWLAVLPIASHPFYIYLLVHQPIYLMDVLYQVTNTRTKVNTPNISEWMCLHRRVSRCITTETTFNFFPQIKLDIYKLSSSNQADRTWKFEHLRSSGTWVHRRATLENGENNNGGRFAQMTNGNVNLCSWAHNTPYPANHRNFINLLFGYLIEFSSVWLYGPLVNKFHSN